MNDTIAKLRILARSELTLTRINARLMATRAIVFAVAIGLLLLTVVMVNLGAYELLAETYGNAQSAFIIAAANGLLAGVLLLVGRQLKPGPEEQMVREIRELALSELTADANAVKHDLQKVGSELENIRSGLSALSGGPAGIAGLAGLASLGPLIAIIIKALKRNKDS
jgi:hypothetical protein